MKTEGEIKAKIKYLVDEHPGDLNLEQEAKVEGWKTALKWALTTEPNTCLTCGREGGDVE